jgi:hypothetical protein
MLVLVVGCTAVGLVAAPAASADVFFVDPGGDNSGACTSAGAGACQTIAGAIVKSRATTGGDTINIAAGTYDEDLNFDQASDDGDSIVGAGPSATKILHGSGDGNFAGVNIGSPTQSPHFQMSDLAIEQDASSNALNMWTSGGSTFNNLTITLTDASNANTAVNVTQSDTTFNHLNLSGAWTGTGIAAEALALTVTDSSIQTNTDGAISMTATAPKSGNLDIQRSVLSMSPSSGLRVVSTQNVDVTMDSSLLTGGMAGLLAGAVNADHTAVLRNVTIDAGNPGVADGGDNGVWSDSVSTNDLMPITLDSSITVEQQRVDPSSGASVSCTDSDVPAQTNTGFSCGAAGNNTASPVSDLFVDAAGGDWHLKTSPPSPAIETGSAAPLEAGESSTDLDGNPRVVDGNFDCVPRRDKGAYEVQTMTNTPPAAGIGAPDSAFAGTPVAFLSTSTDAETPASLTYAWSFSDGGTSTAQNPTHTFTMLGPQQATLKVTDPHGCASMTATHDITIVTPPPAGPGMGTGGHKVAFKLGRNGRQKLGKFVTVKVSCPTDACTASATGSLNVPGAAKRYKLRKASRSLKAGGTATLKLAIPKKARNAARHALKRHKKLTARLSIKITSSTASPASASRTVKLRR